LEEILNIFSKHPINKHLLNVQISKPDKKLTVDSILESGGNQDIKLKNYVITTITNFYLQ